jgi:4-amino-4-deoxy-L-arabinose transferase-like glycosyltransferase
LLVAVVLIVWSAPPGVNETLRHERRGAASVIFSVVLNLLRRHLWWFVATTMAAVLLRLLFVLKLPVIVGDSLVYGDIAKCLINYHMFGVEKVAGWEPTLIRLPGYPFFLVFTFLIWGQDHYIGAMLMQLVFDVLTCFLVADIARRVIGGRAARMAFLLAGFCPFLMNYVATPLTECLEIFCIAAAIDCAVIALDARLLRWWALCGLACAGAILLRPDGGLILICIGLAMLLRGLGEAGRRRELLAAMLLLGAISLSPLVPWTIRNWRVMHVFQPLVTTHASDPGEYLPTGWERWFKSWLIDYASVEDVGFHVPGEAIDVGDIPDRAYNSEAQRALVHRLLDQYNVNRQMTPEMDRQFGALAGENVRLHPVRYYLLLPAARMLDMWFRPRSEMMPLDTHFWKIGKDPHSALCGIALGLLNLAYVAAAVAGAWLMRGRIRYLELLLTYPIVRSLFLAATGAAEDRYTLECFPFVFVLAAGLLMWRQNRRQDAL